VNRSVVYSYLLILILFFLGQSTAQANLQMLCYGPTESTGNYAELTPGYTVTTWNVAQWNAAAALGPAGFAGFDVIVFQDEPECGASDTTWATADATVAAWSPVITGNVFIMGSDPDFHTNTGTCPAGFIQNCVAFAGSAGGGTTGLYMALSCAYNSSPKNTPVSILSGFGIFTVEGTASNGSGNNMHKIAINPALAAVTDTQLSNWNQSIHEGFDSWPASFVPLAIYEGATDPNYVASDGTTGLVYILARGVTAVGSPTPPPPPTPGPTSTPIFSFTPTNTPAITNTPTVTDTPTITNTPTITDTPTITSTPTNTDTITPTYTPSNTCTPTCSNTPTCVSYVWPNPYNPRTAVGGTLRFSCMNNMTLQIFTVSGELVQTVTDGNSIQPCGGNQTNAWGTYYCWDGRNKMGMPVATGIYFFVVAKKDGTVAQRGKFLMVNGS
jgi:hypothetical protein